MRSDSASATARSMTRSSSRTLPGQPWSRSASLRAVGQRQLADVPVTREEVARQLGDVVAPLAQRRHVDLDAAQPVVQVGAEEPLLDHPGERPVGRGDDARVHPLAAGAADALDGQVLHRAQQLGLRRERQVRHFVEEQRAHVGVLELAAAAAHAGRRAILDAEELGFEQRLDHRRAVDGHERSAAPAAQLVNLTRHQLLARAALAFDEHGEIGGGDALDALAQRLPSPGSTR